MLTELGKQVVEDNQVRDSYNALLKAMKSRRKPAVGRPRTEDIDTILFAFTKGICARPPKYDKDAREYFNLKTLTRRGLA